MYVYIAAPRNDGNIILETESAEVVYKRDL